MYPNQYQTTYYEQRARSFLQSCPLIDEKWNVGSKYIELLWRVFTIVRKIDSKKCLPNIYLISMYSVKVYYSK